VACVCGWGVHQGCFGAERGRRILAFPDRTARLTVLHRSATRSYPESHLPPSSCEVSPASFVLRGLTCLLRPARSHLPPSSCEVSPASFVLRALTCLLRPARSHLPPSSCEVSPASFVLRDSQYSFVALPDRTPSLAFPDRIARLTVPDRIARIQ